MFFQQLLNIYANYQATKNIKRYVVGASLSFGKTYTVPLPKPFNIQIKSPIPASGKLKIFNSYKEAISQNSYSGSTETIDVKYNPEFKDIILDPIYIKKIMEYPGNPYEYLKANSFPASLMWRGQQKYFMYDPREMLLYLNYTEDPEAYTRLKEMAQLEASITDWVAKAQRNARALAAFAKIKSQLNSRQQVMLQKEIVNHQYAVNTMKSLLPKGFFMQSVSVNASQINGTKNNAAVGVIPVIVWVVAIIATGIITTGVVIGFYLSKKAEVDKRRNLLDANLQNINAIAAAGILKNQGAIDQGTYNEIVTAANSNINTNNGTLTQYGNADVKEQNSGGIMGKIQNIAIAFAAVFVVKEILKK